MDVEYNSSCQLQAQSLCCVDTHPHGRHVGLVLAATRRTHLREFAAWMALNVYSESHRHARGERTAKPLSHTFELSIVEPLATKPPQTGDTPPMKFTVGAAAVHQFVTTTPVLRQALAQLGDETRRNRQ